jgi:hypothetical protein
MMSDFKNKIYDIINDNHPEERMYIKFKELNSSKSNIRGNKYIVIFKRCCAHVYSHTSKSGKPVFPTRLMMVLMSQTGKQETLSYLEDIKDYYIANHGALAHTGNMVDLDFVVGSDEGDKKETKVNKVEKEDKSNNVSDAVETARTSNVITTPIERRFK